MAKSGDPNHGPGPVLPIYPDPNETTQPTRAVGEITQQNKAVRAKTPEQEPIPEPEKKPVFGFGSLLLLILLVWGAEWIGTTLPGPFDDMLYELIAALFFGLIQYIRSLLYKK